MDFGTRLKELRKSKKLTQQQLGDIIHVSKVSISGYERGERSPDRETLTALADYFNVTTDYLLGRNQTPEWATKEDIIELDKLLESNANMAYGGETLTPEQLQRVRDVLAGMFWKFKKEDKDKEK
ncbi:TPA: helix-turn-helix transcriptional regulator [Enterococcus faecium]|nr:helix-turn-helix transcriptional regulator [Enterococcus faecium]HCR3913922.1 helix-turn-helix transcriptional regulator [Enterococcus faecium]